MLKNKVFITSACRTAVGSLGKTLKNVKAEELGSAVISNAINKSNIKPNELDEITNNTLNYRNLEDPNRILDPENFPYYKFTNFLEMNKQDFIKHKNQDSIEERKTMVKAYTLSTLGNIVFSNLSLSEKVIEISENFSLPLHLLLPSLSNS